MNKEFRKISKKQETRYVLETMTAGATGASSIATSPSANGSVRKRTDSILAQEGDKIKVPVKQKPRQGPLRPQTGGGAHRDKKKEQKQGKEKHRKPFMEDHEISMASNELQSIAADAKKLLILVRRYSEMDGLEAWQQSKITKAADYLNSVLQSIGGEQGVTEEADDLRDSVMNVLQDIYKGAESGQDMIDYLADELNDYYRYVRASKDKTLKQAYQFMMDNGQEAEGNPELMAKIAGQAIQMLNQQGVAEGLRDPKDNPCWKGYKPVGTKQKGGRTVPNCVPKEGAEVEESGLQYYTGVKKHGKEYMVKAAQAARNGASQKELGALKDKYSKAYKESQVNEYETHTYKDEKGNVWRVDDEGNKELVHAAPGGSYGGGSRYGSRYPRRPAVRRSSGMYFYNVKPGQENNASKAGLKQSKSGKWYSTFPNPVADKEFGPGKFWQPNNEGMSEEQGYDEVSPKSASHILRKLDQGVPMSNILDDFPELGRMMEIIAGEHGLHPDDDFEEIEDILMNDLEDIAAQEGDFGDYDQDEEQPDEYMESLAQSLQGVLSEKAPPGDKYERMVKHIKKGYAKDGKITDKERSIAYATAWKAKNKAKK